MAKTTRFACRNKYNKSIMEDNHMEKIIVSRERVQEHVDSWGLSADDAEKFITNFLEEGFCKEEPPLSVEELKECIESYAAYYF